MRQQRYRRKLCLKGRRHHWILNPALTANEEGQLSGKRHLSGRCRRCHKTATFHPGGFKHSFRQVERINLCQERRAA